MNSNKKIIFFLLLMMSLPTLAQTDTVQLLKPTGPLPVGTMIYEWTDVSRTLNDSDHLHDKRTIVVQIWYPADIDMRSMPAPYAPATSDYTKVISNAYFQPAFSKKINSSHLILISPGRGTERYLYSTLAEDLASHGFTVAAVDMPEIGYTIYQNGTIIKASRAYQTPPGMMAGPYEKVDSFYEKPTAIGYEDLAFAFDKIASLNKSDVEGRFTGKINVNSVGIFGHSLGGRIAGAFAEKNKQVKAYISMEGVPPRDTRYQGKLQMPVVMLCSSGTLPYAIANYKSLIDNRKNTVYLVELVDFGHNSVTDNPYLYPTSFKYPIDATKALEISRKLVTGFFETYLGAKSNFPSMLSNQPSVKFTEYK